MKARHKGEMLAQSRKQWSILAACAMTAFLFSSPSGASENRWTRQGGPEGGWVEKLVIDPSSPATVYAALVNGGGLWKSTDGGRNWRSLLGFGVREIAVTPSNPNVIYAGGYLRDLAKSEDGGESWEFLTLPKASDCPYSPDGFCIAVAPDAPGTVLTLTPCGLFRTTDAGETWTSSNSPLQMFNSPWCDIAFAPSSPSTVYAGTYGGVFKSLDAGVTWSSANQGLTTAGVHSFVIDARDPNTIYDATFDGVFKSTNGGATWVSKNSGLENAPYGLVGDPASPNTLYVGLFGGGVYKTTDGGGNWLPAGLSGTSINSLAIDPSAPSTLYAGAIGTGVFKSTNGAEGWVFSSSGLSGTNIISLAASPIDPLMVFAGTSDSGIFRSLDAGRSWERVNSGLSSDQLFPQVWSLSIHPTDLCTMFAGTNEFAGVFRTEDCGEHWVKTGSGLPNDITSALAFDSLAPSTIYAASEIASGIFKSSNGGESWLSRSVGLEGLGVHELEVDRANSSTIFAGTAAGIFKSTDGGESWVDHSEGLEHDNFYKVLIDPTATATMWAAATDAFSGSVYKSTDGGASWLQRNTGLPGNGTVSLALDPLIPSTVFAANLFDGVFRTTDSGATWSRMADGPGSARELEWSAGNAVLYASGRAPANESVGGSYVFAYGPPPEPCIPNSTTLCIDNVPGDRRFKVQVDYATTGSDGLAGAGHPVPLADLGVNRGGLFWFFNQNNPEMLIKILDGTPANNHFWVFYSAGTNVGLTTTVTDTTTGQKVVYTNADRHAALPVQHTSAFRADGTLGAPYTPTESAFNYERDFTQSTVTPSTCITGADTLCIRDRFKVKITYSTTQGSGLTGDGHAIPLSGKDIDDGGLFWFFGQNNPEILVKVLDACALNNRHWVFFSAGTNVGYTLTVEDTLQGVKNEYRNPDHNTAPPVQDTGRGIPCAAPQ